MNTKNKKNNFNKFERSVAKQTITNKPNILIKKGRVIDSLPDTHFRVETDDAKTVVAYLAGKMKMFKIKVLVGDLVEMELDIRGGKGRIVKRL